MRRLLALAAVAATVLAAPAAAPAALPDRVAVGLATSQSGAGAPFGEQQPLGARLAAEEITAAGTLGAGVRLDVLVRDDRSTADGARAAFTGLAADGAAALLGPTLSGVALQADPTAQRLGLPLLAVSNTADGITDAGDLVFRASLAESAVIPDTVRTARAAAGFRRPVMVWRSDEAFAVSGAAAYRRALRRAGVPLVAEAGYEGAEPDAEALLRRLARHRPDALVVEGLNESVDLLRAARRIPALRGVTLLGGNAMNSAENVRRAGRAAEGLFVAAAWHPRVPDPRSQDFVRRFRARYDRTPDLFAAQAYAGVELLGAALHRAGSTDPRAIARALNGLGDEPTILGAVTFDGDRDAVYPPVVQVVRRGRLVPAESAPAATPPTAGRLGFNSDRLGSFDLFAASPSGLGVRALAPAPSRDRRPAFSPDGSQVAFQSDRDGDAEIWVMDADGPGLRRLTDDPGSDFNPAWSPDGRRIAWNSDRSGDFEIYTADARTGDRVRRLTYTPGVDSVPQWTPDSRHLVFESSREGNPDVFVMAADGRRERNLTHHPGEDLAPAVSPDGRHVAFSSDRQGGQLDVFRLDLDGAGGLTNLTRHPADDRTPAWAPDGGTIAFASNRDGTFDIWSLTFDGHRARILAASPETDSIPAFARRLEDGACANARTGTTGDDALAGTPAGDLLTGRGGADLLEGGDGADCLRGGSGDDRLRAAGDGARDTVRCGPGHDTVTAGRRDRVAADCERVARRGRA